MATPRTRSRVIDYAEPGVSRLYYGSIPVGTSPGYSGLIADETCDDRVSTSRPYPDNPLTLTRRSNDPLILNGGPVPSGPYSRFYEDYCSARHSPAFSPVIPTWSWPYWMTKALANINPNRPDVDLPLFLFEFKDFPRMLKQLGDLKRGAIGPKSVPDGFLSYNFGWAPLISDVLSLAKLSELIEKKRKYLTQAAKGTKVNRSLGKIVTNDTGETAGDPKFRTTLTIEEKFWYSARLQLLSDLPTLPDALDGLSKKLVLGLYPSADVLWNAIPWTWLIDYFINIGQVSAANRGFLKFKVTDMNIMRRSIATDAIDSCILNTHGLSWSGGTMVTEKKERVVIGTPVAVPAFQPFLSKKKKAIIGALITASALRRLR